MMLDVRNALKNPGQSYPLSRALELPAMDVLSEEISFGTVCLQGEFVGAGESVRITGQVSSDVHAHCAKCLTPLTQRVDAAVDEIYTKVPDPTDPDQRLLDGYEVELGDIAKDALLLELPMRFLCSADCKGLCPVCGANQNTQRCTCHKGDSHPFAALSGLLKDDEEV